MEPPTAASLPRKRLREETAPTSDPLTDALARATAAEVRAADALARLAAAEARLAAAASTSDALSARVAVMDANFVHTRPDVFLAHITTLLAYNGYGAEAARCIRLCKDAIVNVDLLARVVDIPRGVQRSTGKTLLMHRAWQGDVEGIALLLSMDAAVDAVSAKGDTALVWASRGGHVAACAALLKAGARAPGHQIPSTEYSWRTGDSPLISAARGNHVDVVRLLLSAGAPPTVAAVNAGGKEGVLACLLKAGLSSPTIAAAVCTAVSGLTSSAISDGVPCGAYLLATAIKPHRGVLAVVSAGITTLGSLLQRPDAGIMIPGITRSKLVAELPLAAATHAASLYSLGGSLLTTWRYLAKLPLGLDLIEPDTVGSMLAAMKSTVDLQGQEAAGCNLLLTLMTPANNYGLNSSSRFATAVAARGGVATIAETLKTHHFRSNVVTSGFGALRALVQYHPQHDTIVAALAAAITALVEGYPHGDDLAALGYWTLSSCCYSPSATNAVIAAGGLRRAMATHDSLRSSEAIFYLGRAAR